MSNIILYCLYEAALVNPTPVSARVRVDYIKWYDYNVMTLGNYIRRYLGTL